LVGDRVHTFLAADYDWILPNDNFAFLTRQQPERQAVFLQRGPHNRAPDPDVESKLAPGRGKPGIKARALGAMSETPEA
jgi:hypothetical protein